MFTEGSAGWDTVISDLFVCAKEVLSDGMTLVFL